MTALALLFLAALFVWWLWLWHRAASRSLDAHIRTALELANACDCGVPSRRGWVHDTRLCQPRSEALP